MGRGNKAIYKDFYENSGAAFQIKCHEWLKFLFPKMRNSTALGEVDRDGVDLYTLNRKNEYIKAIQCKGFEKTFSDSQLKQCIKSVSTFIKKNQKCKDYILILNHEVDAVQHRLLSTEVQKIKDKSLADTATYLTPQTFINYYNKEFRKYILNKISKSNRRFFDNYNAIMEQKFYLENVPFHDGQKAAIKIRPTTFLWEKCQNDIGEIIDKAVLSKVPSKFVFVISEFGFGKTSLLFNFFHFLISKDYIPVYLPVSAFRAQTFDNTSNITKEVFRIISQADFDGRNKFLKFSAEAMGTLLVHNPRIVLMFDGLDEHKSLYNKDGLKTLFESTNDLVAPIIFAFRKSFWEERHGDFEFSRIKPNRKNIQTELFLTEWPETTIEEYIQLFVDLNAAQYDQLQLERLEQLKKVIKNKQYETFYGDIPKRPLFLEMIIRDVLNGSIQQRSISDLYLAYFSEKFKRDLKGQIDGLFPQRYFPDISIDAAQIALIEIHTQLAGRCIRLEDIDGYTSLVVENIINEQDLVHLLTQYSFSHDIGKFLPFSVLTPILKRNNTRMRLKFVHKSFLEFFQAKYLFENIVALDNKFLSSRLLEFEYPKAVTNFFTALINTNAKEQPSILLSTLRTLKQFEKYPLINLIRKRIEHQ